MARISGINIPVNKHVAIGLTHIYGIGHSRAKMVCVAAGVDPSTKVRDLTEAEVAMLRTQISRFLVEGDLRRENSMLSRNTSSQRTAGSRPAHAHQCAHAQGTAPRGDQDQRRARQALNRRRHTD
jgi:ribosomal protein S13